ncbi:hypothetical protein llg_17170 [Luteolibacter sp. LG18]|nr:hypothetical protein llg_17170 [Luteolibacter sp. LG18]
MGVLPLVSLAAKDLSALVPEKLAIHNDAWITGIAPYRNGVIFWASDETKDGVTTSTGETVKNELLFTHFDSNAPVPLRVEGIDHIWSYERIKDGLLFFGMRASHVVLLVESRDGTRKSIPVPKEWLPDLSSCSLVRSDLPAMRIGDTFWWFEREWHHFKFEAPMPPDIQDRLRPSWIIFTHLCFQRPLLHASWSLDEGDCQLAAMDLSARKPAWKMVTGREPGDDTGIEDSGGVAILLPLGKELWTASGTDHMGMNTRELYRRDASGKWHTVIRGFGDRNEGPVSLPIANTLESINAGSDQRLLLITKSEVYRWNDGRFETLLSLPQRPEPHPSLQFLKTATVSQQGDLFVMTRSFGMLAFGERDSEWQFKQFLPRPSSIPRRVTSEMEAIAIAQEAWKAAYGEKTIAHEKPYKAVHDEGVWLVTSTPPSDGRPSAKAIIGESDGRVWSLSHRK